MVNLETTIGSIGDGGAARKMHCDGEGDAMKGVNVVDLAWVVAGWELRTRRL